MSGCLVVFPRVPAPLPPNKDTPEAIAKDYWELLLAESPLWATAIGDRRFDAVMPDLSPLARESTHRNKEELQQRISLLNGGLLIGESLTTARVLAHAMQADLGADVCNMAIWSVDPLDGIPALLMRLAQLQPMDDSTAAAAYLTRLGAVGGLLDQHIANLQYGAQRSFRAPREMVERVIRQVQVMVTQNRLESPFLGVLDRAYGWAPADLRSFREDMGIVLGNTVYPALRNYLKFLMEDYLPQARDNIALTRIPDGDACYSALIRRYAGADLDPQALHDLGQAELDIARARMTALAAGEGFDSTAAYAAAQSGKPKAYAATRDALLEHYRHWVHQAREAMPKAFVQTGDARLELHPVSMVREQDVLTDSYEPAPLDAPGRAVFYVNTRSPRSRPMFFMEAHAFHHTYPGHHLQLSSAQSLKDLPALRRSWGDPQIREGWSAYAEVLADELGLYSGPAARFGMVHSQAEHAARLVVDTGVHIFGWTRADAIKFMRDNLVLSDEDISAEVDRAIAHPGRAIAFVVGRLFFQTLRAEAERKAGSAFDLKAFHEHLLAEGVPHAAVISDRVRAWLSQGI